MFTKQIGGIVAVIVIVVGGGAFYGGMQYAQSTQTNTFGNRTGGGGGTGTRVLFNRGAGFTAGSVVAKDAQSITIKMMDGSTKIVLLAGSTEVSKMAAGTMADVAVGSNVIVTGTANPDGSLTAQTVQLRPAGSTFPGSARQGTPTQ